MPYRQSLGMGGSAALGGGCGGSEEYDKGLVQKMVLTILKCVALTTREARYGQKHPHDFYVKENLKLCFAYPMYDVC